MLQQCNFPIYNKLSTSALFIFFCSILCSFCQSSLGFKQDNLVTLPVVPRSSAATNGAQTCNHGDLRCPLWPLTRRPSHICPHTHTDTHETIGTTRGTVEVGVGGWGLCQSADSDTNKTFQPSANHIAPPLSDALSMTDSALIKFGKNLPSFLSSLVAS